MRVLVTGRNGQVAQSLAELARARSELEITFAARPETDLAEPGNIASAIDRVRPELVINAAAYTEVDRAEEEPELAFRINGEAAGEVAEAAARIGAPIIQLSTDYVFDGHSGEPYREDAPTGPLNVYGASKLAGEEAVRAANPRHLILRTSWVISPFGRNFARTMFRLAAERAEIAVVEDQLGSPTSAIDLAEAILRIAESWRAKDQPGMGRTLHLAGGGVTSWAGLAAQIMEDTAALGGPAARIRPITTEEYPTAARRPAYSALDSTLFGETFGFTLPKWEDQTRRLVHRLIAGRSTL